MKKKNQKNRILLIVLSFAGLLAALFPFYAGNFSGAVTQTSRQYFLTNMVQKNEIIDRKINEMLEQTTSLAQRFSAYDSFVSPEIESAMEQVKKVNNYYDCSLFNSYGVNYMENKVLDNIQDASLMQTVMGGTACVTDYSHDERPLLLFAVPVYKNNQPAAVMTVSVYAEELERSVLYEAMNLFDNTYVVNDEGEILLFGETGVSDIYELLEQNGEKNTLIANDMQNRVSNVLPVKTITGSSKTIVYTPVKQANHLYLVEVANNKFLIPVEIWKSIVLVLLVVIGFILLYLLVFFGRNMRKINGTAFSDNLTGIMTYNKFLLEADTYLSDKNSRDFVYVNFNINNFKLINTMFSFETGNEFLRHIGACLERSFSQDGLFARINSDSFAILFEAPTDDAAVIGLKRLTADICDFGQKFGKLFDINLSYGIYRIEENISVSAMNDRAHTAMRKQKGNYVHSYSFYNEILKEEVDFQNKMECEMRIALEDEQFIICFQPKYNLQTLSVTGAEALVRWQHPQRGLLNPIEFIPLFEKNGFITKMDAFVFDAVCRKIREWMDKGYQIKPISVNVSRANFGVDNFEEKLYCTVKKHNIPIHLIELEITETLFFEDTERMISCVNRLNAYGFSISLDDFGTGYSSLNSIRKLPIDVLKIDKEFLENDISSDVIDSILYISGKLGLKTVAEGVETKDQYDYLKKTSCDMVQGFFLARPMICEDFEKWMFFNQC